MAFTGAGLRRCAQISCIPTYLKVLGRKIKAQNFNKRHHIEVDIDIVLNLATRTSLFSSRPLNELVIP